MGQKWILCIFYPLYKVLVSQTPIYSKLNYVQFSAGKKNHFWVKNNMVLRIKGMWKMSNNFYFVAENVWLDASRNRFQDWSLSLSTIHFVYILVSTINRNCVLLYENKNWKKGNFIYPVNTYTHNTGTCNAISVAFYLNLSVKFRAHFPRVSVFHSNYISVKIRSSQFYAPCKNSHFL